MKLALNKYINLFHNFQNQDKVTVEKRRNSYSFNEGRKVGNCILRMLFAMRCNFNFLHSKTTNAFKVSAKGRKLLFSRLRCEIGNSYLCNRVINAFLGTRCVDCHSRPQVECDNTHRVPKKAFIIELYTTFFAIKAKESPTFRHLLRKS